MNFENKNFSVAAQKLIGQNDKILEGCDVLFLIFAAEPTIYSHSHSPPLYGNTYAAKKCVAKYILLYYGTFVHNLKRNAIKNPRIISSKIVRFPKIENYCILVEL